MSRHKLTLSLPPEVITKAKILAAQRKISLSALFTASIEDMATRDEAYEAASRRALTYLDQGFDLGAVPTSRGDLHARAGLRGF
jgi:predicted transcriptional regulator